MIYRFIAVLAVVGAGAACRTAGVEPTAEAPAPPQIVQPGAPGQSSKVVTAEQASDLSAIKFTAADVRFMQGMIGHHAQAIEMAALLPTRTSREDMKKLALRIEVSQADEINMMQAWLKRRGQALPDPHAHHAHDAKLMPGMLTGEQMAALAAAKGVAFDRLFLAGMIRHHGGALTMVQELFSTPGAGQEPDVFEFASEVDSDQRMEIDRMGALLKELMK